MKKIMFKDRYGLTDRVLSGAKTQTRRIIPQVVIDFPRSGRVKVNNIHLEHQLLMMDLSNVLNEPYICAAPKKYQSRYEEGEEVAIGMSYEDAYAVGDIDIDDWIDTVEHANGGIDYCLLAGCDNKMFTKADLMPARIRIKHFWLQRLQDISEADCIAEGVVKTKYRDFPQEMYLPYIGCKESEMSWTPQGAFQILIDKVSGRGTWDRNPWVYAYQFELIKPICLKK